MVPLKMEGVRISTQGSVSVCGGGSGGGTYFKTYFTEHFRPTPSAWGRHLKRKVKEKDPASRGVGQRGGGQSTHALHPLPITPPIGFFFFFFPMSSTRLGGFQRWSEGTGQVRKKGRRGGGGGGGAGEGK